MLTRMNENQSRINLRRNLLNYCQLNNIYVYGEVYRWWLIDIQDFCWAQMWWCATNNKTSTLVRQSFVVLFLYKNRTFKLSNWYVTFQISTASIYCRTNYHTFILKISLLPETVQRTAHVIIFGFSVDTFSNRKIWIRLQFNLFFMQQFFSQIAYAVWPKTTKPIN